MPGVMCVVFVPDHCSETKEARGVLHLVVNGRSVCGNIMATDNVMIFLFSTHCLVDTDAFVFEKT